MFLVAAVLAMAAPVPKPGPDWVTVKGAVVWPEKEKVPEAKAYDLSEVRGGDAEYILKGGAVFDDKFAIDEKSRGLKNVVVWLRPDDDDPKAAFPAEKVHPDLAKPKAKTHTVTNEFCRFDRRVLAVRAGDSVEWVNKGRVTLLIKVDGGPDDNHTFTHLPGKDPVTTEFKKTGWFHFVDLGHQWKVMNWPPGTGWVKVFDHPYFALTNENGEFEMMQVPKGKWRVMYWHESGFHKGKDGRLGFKVEVEGNKEGVMTMKPLAFEVPKK